MDFSEYVAARRASLVRAVVLLGCPVADAEDIVQSALLKCHRSWRRVQRADQPEAYVYRVLVNTYRDARSRRWTGEVPAAELPDGPVEADHLTGIEVRRAPGLDEPRPPRGARAPLLRRPLRGPDRPGARHTARDGQVPDSRALAALSAHPSLRSPDAH